MHSYCRPSGWHGPHLVRAAVWRTGAYGGHCTRWHACTCAALRMPCAQPCACLPACLPQWAGWVPAGKPGRQAGAQRRLPTNYRCRCMHCMHMHTWHPSYRCMCIHTPTHMHVHASNAPACPCTHRHMCMGCTCNVCTCIYSTCALVCVRATIARAMVSQGS